LELAELRPETLEADAAVLTEPTGGVVEAGCQGSLRLVVRLGGTRAHTARPFAGRNAIHRMGDLVSRIASYEPRRVVIDDVVYTEQMQVVAVSGGVAANVVPDEAQCTINHRVAPDRQLDGALAGFRALVGDLIGDGDEVEVEDYAPPAAPALDHEVISRLVAATGQSPRAKVGWTDVATFAELGVPSANFGAGDPLLAHHSNEFVTADELDEFQRGLAAFLD
jgi:succinyl-diaminopimelate desuccinylase